MQVTSVIANIVSQILSVSLNKINIIEKRYDTECAHSFGMQVNIMKELTQEIHQQ